MEGMNFLREGIGKALYRVGAIQDKRKSPNGKGFKLKLHEKKPNAPLSPIYLNFRTPDNPKPGPLTLDLVAAIGQRLFFLACELKLKYDFVVGIPRAGDPIAEAFVKAVLLFRQIEVPLLKLGKQEFKRTRRIVVLEESVKIIEQAAVDKKIPLIIDDLITQSHSKEEAISALEYYGLKPYDILVLVDREQGGQERLYQQGYRLHADFGFSELLDFYVAEGLMHQLTYDEIKKYLADN